ncbi:MAG: orotate phosphoribosyltransferase [Flavobacteriales bacterium]|jgi:orotate phosphoribosyltransferase|nr:orotate phosphoribosyltransferase [Flavobacteriales bacterium]MDP7429991.1 orotate phosphoribosyltransferase [Flavobacteriales bacterium]HJN63461.1 orotate phosphoribosyltransferase [Flavobacteriales bacterium]|tara:strand:- start:3608 stop:4249 length:642 start_codon:yes stop_codon:yes gene_type:complete
MISDIEIGKQLAKFLLQINAIILQPGNPFTWASGWKSPIYCDNRKILSFPKSRTYIRQSLVKVISKHYGSTNVIAGVATGAIAHGALVAEEMGLPFIYVRSAKKEHGKQNRVEGAYNSGQSVIVIEDLISSGKSCLEAVEALRKEGLNVKGLISIFTYGFDVATKNFKKANCEFISLCNYSTLLQVAVKQNYIKQSDLEVLEKWRKNPSKWKK